MREQKGEMAGGQAAMIDGASRVEAGRESVANTLDAAAERVHARADQMTNGKLATVADKAAGALDSTASFVREFDSNKMLDDVGAMARRHPGRTLAAAVIVGFLLGRSLSRSST